MRIVQGDALSAGLDRDSFDLVHERLVLVNVPERRELVREMVSLTAPGGVIALGDIDNVSRVCEPGRESWTVLLEVFHQTFRAGGGDPFVGRRLAGLLAQAGVLDVQMSVHAALPATGTVPARKLDRVRERMTATPCVGGDGSVHPADGDGGGPADSGGELPG